MEFLKGRVSLCNLPKINAWSVDSIVVASLPNPSVLLIAEYLNLNAPHLARMLKNLSPFTKINLGWSVAF